MIKNSNNRADFVIRRPSIRLALTHRQKILCAFFYSLFVALIPWEYLLGFSFPDKLNYIARFEQLQSLGFDSVNPSGGVLGAFTAEALWGLILYWFGATGFSAEQALFFISFICLFSITAFVFSKVNPAVGAIFLLNPLVIDFVMAQQRSAIVFAGFLVFITTKKHWLKCSVIASSLFIHVAFVLLVAGYYLACALARLKFTERVSINRIIHFLVVLFAAMAILVSKDIVLGALGDRRAGGQEGSQSMMYAIFWAALAGYIVLFGRSRSDRVSNFGLLFTSLFLMAVILNIYSSRYLVFALPFLILALAGLPSKEAFIGYCLLFCYQLVQWIYWWGWFTR